MPNGDCVRSSARGQCSGSGSGSSSGLMQWLEPEEIEHLPEDDGSIPPPPFRRLGNFFHPILPVSFRRDAKSRWSKLLR